jgi:hypothetical protein
MVNVQGMSSYFNWDWSQTTLFNSTISGFGVANNGNKPLEATHLTIRNWGKCDSVHSTLTGIVLNGTTLFTGSVQDGNQIDVVDFSLPVLTSWSNNDLTFNGTINDENESFIADVNFSDGTDYTSPVFAPGGLCNIDTNAPAKVNDLRGIPGPEPGSVVLTFTYPGDDQNKGTATNAIFKFSRQDMADDTSFNAATTIPFSGPFLQGGSAGSLLVTDMNVGYTYQFAVKFMDENENASSISNRPVARPWNSFLFSGNDFNFDNMAWSYALVSTKPDVNEFKLKNLATDASISRQIVLRIVTNTKTWITALDFNSTDLNRLRIWYPTNGYVGVPSVAPQYDKNVTGQAISSTLDLLRASLIPSTYRYDNSSISITQPNNLYLDIFYGFTDMNLVFDMTSDSPLIAPEP